MPRHADDLPPPPQNLDAERAVLGAILLEPTLLPRAADLLTAEAFHKDSHRAIFRAMLRCQARHELADAITVAEELRRDGAFEEAGGHTALVILQEEGTVATQLDPYAQIVREYAAKRRLAQLGHDVATAAFNGHSSGEILGQLRQTLDSLELRDDATVLAVDAVDLCQRTPAPEPGLVVGILERRSLAALGGAPKLGKTALVFDLVLSGLVSQTWLGFDTRLESALVFQAELPPPQIGARIRVRLQDFTAPLLPGRLHVVSDRTLRLDDPAEHGRIRRLVDAHRPALVVFDPLARFMIGNENATQDMGRVVAFLDRLIQDFRVSVLLVHHTGKPSKDDPREGGQRLRGSSALFAAADSVLMLERSRGHFSLSFELRHAPAPEPLILQRTDRLGFERAEVAGELRVVAELAGTGKRFGALRDDLMELQGVSKATAARLIGTAKKLGLVTHEDGVYRSHGLTESHDVREPGGSGDEG